MPKKITIEASSHFGLWLRETLNSQGITARSLGDVMGVPPKDIRNWIAGRSIPKTYYYLLLCEGLQRLTGTHSLKWHAEASKKILKDC